MSTVGNAASLVRIPAPGALLAVPPAGAEARRLAARTALASSAGARVPSWGTRCGRSPGAPRSARRSSLAASTVRANQGWITSRHAWGSSDVGARRLPHGGARAVSPEPLPEVVTHPERVRHDGERRVHGTARGEEARVDDVKVVDVVGLAVNVESRGLGIPPEAYRAVLMRHAGERDARRDVGVQGNQVVVAADLLEHALELRDEALVPLLVVRRVGEGDPPIAIDGDAVVRVGQILGGEPDGERV